MQPRLRAVTPFSKFLFVAIWLVSFQTGWTDEVIHPTGKERNLSRVYGQDSNVDRKSQQPVALNAGPHLFIDDYLIDSSKGIMRRVNVPQRDASIPNPIVTAEEGDRCVGPYMTVLHDPETSEFRIWYNGFTNGHFGKFASMESKDGVHWNRPARLLDVPWPLKWDCSVIDDGPRAEDPSQRYKLAWYANPKGQPDKIGGLMIATSPDGTIWKSFNSYPIIRHNHDINGMFFDPIRQHYVYTFSCHVEDPAWNGKRRTTFQCTSKDLLHWNEPWIIIKTRPDLEHIETQFYSMDGLLARGDLLIGMVKVLRDDLKADATPAEAFGMGYTTLAWSRDGRHWVRDMTPFFEPDAKAGAWDHAHAWIDEQLLVGDELRLYYGGYKNGHKMGRTTDRQLGLVSIPRDRYVAREANGSGGTLRTVPVMLEGQPLSINADVKGSLQVRLLDPSGQAMQGFDYENCQSISGDSLDHEVRWTGDVQSLEKKPVQIEFRMKSAKLYGFATKTRENATN